MKTTHEIGIKQARGPKAEMICLSFTTAREQETFQQHPARKKEKEKRKKPRKKLGSEEQGGEEKEKEKNREDIRSG